MYFFKMINYYISLFLAECIKILNKQITHIIIYHPKVDMRLKEFYRRQYYVLKKGSEQEIKKYLESSDILIKMTDKLQPELTEAITKIISREQKQVERLREITLEKYL